MAQPPMVSNLSAHPGILHRYVRSKLLIRPTRISALLTRLQTARLVAYEYPHLGLASSPPENTLLFISGLGDGLLTVPYTIPLAASLPPTWSLIQPLLTSSYSGWGTSSLSLDVAEIAKCITYIRTTRPSGKIVLMGHSTGSQDVMHYFISPHHASEAGNPQPKIDGGILQASVSDREALVETLPPGVYDASVALAREYVATGRAEDVLPSASTSECFSAPICARRWLSLTSPGPEHDGEEDYFSSDLSYERLKSTFGKMGANKASGGGPVRISFLYGGADQFVPAWVDKAGLVRKWEGFVKEGGGIVDEGSGIVEGASHNLDGVPEAVLKDLVARVVGFLERV